MNWCSISLSGANLGTSIVSTLEKICNEKMWDNCILEKWPTERFYIWVPHLYDILTSWHRNAFLITELSWGESTVHWWVPLQRANDAELCYCLFIVWTSCWTNIKLPVIWDALTLMWRHCQFYTLQEIDHVFHFVRCILLYIVKPNVKMNESKSYKCL